MKRKNPRATRQSDLIEDVQSPERKTILRGVFPYPYLGKVTVDQTRDGYELVKEYVSQSGKFSRQESTFSLREKPEMIDLYEWLTGTENPIVYELFEEYIKVLWQDWDQIMPGYDRYEEESWTKAWPLIKNALLQKVAIKNPMLIENSMGYAMQRIIDPQRYKKAIGQMG